MKALSVDAFQVLIQQGAVILDTRDSNDFKTGFIQGSIHIPFDRKFMERVQSFFAPNQLLVIVANKEHAEEICTTLQKSGYSNINGYLSDGFEAWKNDNQPYDMIIEVDPDELMMDIPFDNHLVVVDVRGPIAFAGGHLKQAINLPLQEIINPLRITALAETDNLYLHCGGGSSAFIAATILKSQGMHNLRVVTGGWERIKNEDKAEIVKEPRILN